MAEAHLFEGSFEIRSFNTGKYDRVGRISATSNDNDTVLTLDINTDLYSVAPSETIHLLLASTLNLDGTKDEEGT